MHCSVPSIIGGGPGPHAHGEEGIRVELQKELQRALDRRQRRQRSQSVSSTSRDRHKDASPDKVIGTHN